MSATNQGACQSRKTAKNADGSAGAAEFPDQQLVRIPTRRLGTFANAGASDARIILKEFE
jgi:hypothetical protein